MFAVVVYFLLVQIVLSFHISIDGSEKGNDSNSCIQGYIPCQSLQYVAMKTSKLSNVTIEIISSSLNLSGSAVFSNINGLTLSGNIKCNQSFSDNFNGSGVVFNLCKNVILSNFPWKVVDYTIAAYGIFLFMHSKQYFSNFLATLP